MSGSRSATTMCRVVLLLTLLACTIEASRRRDRQTIEAPRLISPDEAAKNEKEENNRFWRKVFLRAAAYFTGYKIALLKLPDKNLSLRKQNFEWIKLLKKRLSPKSWGLGRNASPSVLVDHLVNCPVWWPVQMGGPGAWDGQAMESPAVAGMLVAWRLLVIAWLL
ncbi:hypothetical protein ElyMa_001765700 [Elysia marginata]|uniref:Lipase maturation factor n=1 Tax=Elysia marginata TaxID=1093978 RepID=A0AAV4ECA1_9GAST|nr:hypothetical protein ElyMa_001765700 [Elysia marginata]